MMKAMKKMPGQQGDGDSACVDLPTDLGTNHQGMADLLAAWEEGLGWPRNRAVCWSWVEVTTTTKRLVSIKTVYELILYFSASFYTPATAFSGAEHIMSRPDHSVIDFGVPFHISYQPILMKFGMWLRLPFNRKDQVPDLTQPPPPTVPPRGETLTDADP